MSTPQSLVSKAPSLKTFNSKLKKYGVGLSNFYGVGIFTGSSGNGGTILDSYLNTADVNWGEKVAYYCDEVNIPGLQLATGEYRVGGMPQFKYAHSNTYTEVTLSFIMDGESSQKAVFDAWLNFIYGMSSSDYNISNNFVANSLLRYGKGNAYNNIGRVMYPDDYVADIAIVKYERYGNGQANTKGSGVTIVDDVLNNTQSLIQQITNDKIEVNNFDKTKIYFPNSKATYSIRLIDAFPTSVSSLPLSAGSSQLLRVSVTFEYKYHLTSRLEPNNSIFDGIRSSALPT